METPSWFKRNKSIGLDPVDEIQPLPTIARIEEVPAFTPEDEERLAMENAARVHARFVRERQDFEEKIKQLEAQLAEASDNHKGENKKVTFLELENLQLRNDIQTLQSELTDIRRYLSLQKQVYDRFNVKAPEKKPRKKKTVETVPPGGIVEVPYTPEVVNESKD